MVVPVTTIGSGTVPRRMAGTVTGDDLEPVGAPTAEKPRDCAKRKTVATRIARSLPARERESCPWPQQIRFN